MSKSKTIIAGLGVVAALGVAALPLASYAANQTAVSGNVLLAVEVEPAIAMTIVGNNDDNSGYGTSGDNAAVAVKNPSAAATTIDGQNVSDFDTATASKASSSYTSLLPNSVVEGGDFKSTITVYTNSTTGYALTVIDDDTSASLVKGSDSIPVTAATPLTGGTAAWGYRVGTSGDWLAMPVSTAAAASIKSTSTKKLARSYSELLVNTYRLLLFLNYYDIIYSIIYQY